MKCDLHLMGGWFCYVCFYLDERLFVADAVSTAEKQVGNHLIKDFPICRTIVNRQECC